MMDSCTLKLAGTSTVSVYNDNFFKLKASQQLLSSPQFYDPRCKEFTDINSQFMGQSLVVSDQRRVPISNKSSPKLSIQAQASLCVSKAMRWWDKTLKPNMVEIHSAPEFVDALKCAGDRLVIVDFYSPGCGGCKSLHPKICQMAELHPDAIFLKVNYEELKPMCHALHIHVLPFFRFYKGAEGRVCSFSCTISTIKKFKDAMAKHNVERRNLGPAKGLEESELLKLASIGELSLNPLSQSSSSSREGKFEEMVLGNIDMSNPFNMAANNAMLMA